MSVHLTQIIIESGDPKRTQKFYADLGFKFNLTIDKKGFARAKNGKKRNGSVLAVFKSPKGTKEYTAIVINTNNLDTTLSRIAKKWPNCYIGEVETDTVGNRFVLLFDPGSRKVFLIEPARFSKEQDKKRRK